MGAALQNAGRPVLITRCTGQMPHCSMMVGHKVPLAETARAKKSMCAQCEENLSAALRAYRFTSIALADLHTDKLQELLDDIAVMPSEDLLHVCLEDCPAAMMVQYDFGLEAKVAFSLKNTSEWLELFRAHVANTVVAGFYAKSIAQLSSPTHFLTFNQYSQCNMVRFMARKYGTHFKSITYSSHLNIDCSQFWIYDKGFDFILHKHVAQWPKWRDVPIPAIAAFECWQDVIFRNQGQGSHIYSVKQSGKLEELFNSLALREERKLIVAFTSSNDELVGAQGIAEFWGETLQIKGAFLDQISWLRDLHDWVLTRDDVQVVVRVHPREGKGKNYNHESAHLEQLRQALPQNSEKFRVVWPTEPISSYDLLELAHACVIPWTSMGAEASRVGVPTLSWVDGIHYADDDFIQVVPTYKEYRKCLDMLPDFIPTWQTLTRAVRFYHWRTFVTSLDLRSTVPIGCHDASIWPMPPAEMEKDIVTILDGEQGVIEYQLARWQASLHEKSEAEELAAILEGIRALIEATFYPPVFKPVPLWFRVLRKSARIVLKKELRWKEGRIPRVKDFERLRLECHSTPQDSEILLKKTHTDSNLRILVTDGTYNEYYAHGQCLRRMSKMIGRLAGYLSSKPWENA